MVHVEVRGKDGAKLQKFYSDVLGWSFDTNNPGGYGMERQGDMTAGVGASQDGGRRHGHVLCAHGRSVRRCSTRSSRVAARVIMPLTEVAPETTIALFADPEGHIVGLM